jgi:hypothetical protein
VLTRNVSLRYGAQREPNLRPAVGLCCVYDMVLHRGQGKGRAKGWRKSIPPRGEGLPPPPAYIRRVRPVKRDF